MATIDSSKEMKNLWDNYYMAAPQRHKTTRRAIQNSQESLRVLAKKYGINPKTVAKWKKREVVADSPMEPK